MALPHVFGTINPGPALLQWLDDNFNYVAALVGTGGLVVQNVKSKGAVGDGVTVGTVAIQAATDAVGAGGGIVYFPPGIYRTTMIAVTFPNTTFLLDPAATLMAMTSANNEL